MRERICVPKKNIFLGMLAFFILLVVGLSRLALNSNQANNSKAAAPSGIPVAVLPTLQAPDCYVPSPRQYCLTPIYSRGIMSLDLVIPKRTASILMDSITSADRYAIYRVRKTPSGGQMLYPMKTMSVEDFGKEIGKTDPHFTFPSVNPADIDMSSYVLFGIDSKEAVLTTCSQNTFSDTCVTLKND